MELSGIHGGDLRKIVTDALATERMQPHSDDGSVSGDLAPKDLEDADLRRSVGLVFEADHPQRDQAIRISVRGEPRFDDAGQRRVETLLMLGLADPQP
ncbi:hypothetical protein [Cryobacterium algoritolerans]|uniref:hypothetical protein n=1 Tax=Cryobacterium algoritolerans TaxID=1259184 RepID=UPI00141B6473|nr:hypothetical protein [Cryobacterium algoritolerans]